MVTVDDCRPEETTVNARIDGAEATLRSLYSAIKRRQPLADIVVGGYPWVVEPDGPSDNPLCWETRVSDAETAMINRLASRMNARIASAAERAHVWSVGQRVRVAFVGHNACSGEEWIHAGNLDLGGEIGGLLDAKTFHPNDAGQLGYALVFSDTIIDYSG